MNDPGEPCPHLRPGTWPLAVELVLDEHLPPTDFLASCAECGRVYLLEMLDWRSAERVMRLAVVEAEHARRLIRDLGRGSCDVGRAGAEVHQITSTARRLPWLLLMDAARMRIEAVVPAPADQAVPGAGWRELTCDGSWVDYARSYVEMRKE